MLLEEAKQVCPATTRRPVGGGALLVDVRDRTEVARAAFDVSAIVNIPLFELERRFGELPADRELIMVCENLHVVGQHREAVSAESICCCGGATPAPAASACYGGEAAAPIASAAGCCASDTDATAQAGCC